MSRVTSFQAAWVRLTSAWALSCWMALMRRSASATGYVTEHTQWEIDGDMVGFLMLCQCAYTYIHTLHYIILYYNILYHITIYYNILYYIIIYYIILQYIIIYYIILYYIILL